MSISKKIKKQIKKRKFFCKTPFLLLTIQRFYDIILKRREETGCSAVGSARGLGPWGREFESLHPDQKSNDTAFLKQN